MIGYLRNLFSYRELLYFLVVREVKAKYKQTVLGVSWAILQPLVLMMVFTIVFSFFTRLPSDGVPYPIFSYCALLPWTFFAGVLGRGTAGLVANAALVKKVYFPREIIPLAVALSALVDLLVGGLLFLGFFWYFQIPLTVSAAYVLPVFLVQFVLVLGLVLFLSPLHVFYRDVGHVTPLLLQVWMFATPIIYPLSVVPERLRPLYALNPMAGVIDGYRRALLHGQPPDALAFGIGALAATVIFAVGLAFFKRVEFRLADVI
jgi:lipopolysaccharide transport system permease protein